MGVPHSKFGTFKPRRASHTTFARFGLRPLAASAVALARDGPGANTAEHSHLQRPDPHMIHAGRELCSRHDHAHKSTCAEQWHLVLALLDLQLNVIGFSTAISAMGSWPRALHLLQVMPGRAVTPDRYSISACGENWAMALQCLSWCLANVSTPSVFSFNAAVNSCGKAGHWQIALGLLMEFPERVVLPNAVSYSSAISAAAMAGKWQIAIFLLDDMASADIDPDEISCCSAISACEAGAWQCALQILDDMLAAVILPNAISCSSTVSACEKCGQWQMVLCLLAEMRLAAAVPDEITYNSAISACKDAGRWQLAVWLLQELRAAKVRPQQISYTSVTFACERASQQCVM
ncbi:unnamed protein product [Effrenium voratum]|nr:unnamed protein product [Effrenium voratum]